MASFCIRKEYIQKLKDSVASLSSDGQISKLTDMSTSDRIEFFKKTLNTNEATALNKEFEKALADKKLRALGDFINRNLNESYRKDEIHALSREFKNLDEVNSFIEGKVNSIADKKLGISLTESEVKKFTELGKKMYEEGIKLGTDFIDLSSEEGYNKALGFGKAHKEIEEFSRSLMPVSAWKSFANRIGRATMLTSLKTPFLNIESNLITGVTQAIARRISGSKLTSSVEKGLQWQYIKNANKFFKETGIDMTRMISFEDTVAGAGKITGEAVSDGKFLKGYTDFIFNKTLSTPDVAFGSFAFSESAALSASKIAKGDVKKSSDIFKDSLLLNPKTDEGQIVRVIAIADARMATYTNESFSSKQLEKTRQLLNAWTGIGGDILMPFVKTPANVAELGADYAGLGFIKGGVKGGKQLYTRFVKKGEVDRDAMRSAINDITRAGLGLTLGGIIAAQLDADDFMGAYDPQRVKIDQLSNTAYNAVKIHTDSGDKWVSVDYFGSIGSTIVGYMYAKKYGEGNRIKGYVAGSTTQYLSAVGVGEALGSVTDTLKKIDPDNKADMAKIFGDDLKRGTADLLVSRMVPGFLYDMARATDEVQRDTRQKKFVVNTPLFDVNFDQLANKIPYWREDLPVKFDALGRTMYEESAIDSMMFGARVRTSKMDDTVSEIYRLRDAGFLPTVKDLRFMYSPKVDELKEKTGDKFYEVARKYGETIAIEYKKEMDRNKTIMFNNKPVRPYSKLSDEEKQKRISDIGQKVYEDTLKSNGIKYR